MAKELVFNYRNLQRKTKTKILNNNKIVVNLKNINFKKLNKIDGSKEVKEIIYSIKENNILNYFDQFIIQGSIASYDFVKNWSDFDTLVIIKDNVLLDENKLLKLRIKLRNLYKSILKFQSFNIMV